MAHIKNDIISGVEVQIDCNSRGQFQVTTAGGEALGHGDTMEKAIQQARPKLRQKKVVVSIRFLSKAGETGEAYGLHAGTGAVLARLDGKATQLDSGFRYSRVFRSDMPREKLDRFLALDAEIRERQRELGTIEREWEFDVTQATRRAVADEAERQVKGEED